MIYYSQPATRQDEWVIERTDGLRDGFFVEVGAHDGVRHSNTLTLEKEFGWTGILIEGDPRLHKRCMIYRPNCNNINTIVGPGYGEGLFILGDQFGGLWEHMPENWQKEHRSRSTPVVDCETKPLIDVLRNRTPPVIDYLSIDVEGAEYEILKSYFESRALKPTVRYMTVEFRLDKHYLDKLIELLDPWFELEEVRAWDACFVNRTLG